MLAEIKTLINRSFLFLFPGSTLLVFLPFILDWYLLPRVIYCIVIILVCVFFKKNLKAFSLSLYSFTFGLFSIFALILSSKSVNTSEAIYGAMYYAFFVVLLIFLQKKTKTFIQKENLIIGFFFSSTLLVLLIGLDLLTNTKLDINNIESLAHLRSPLGHKNISAAGLTLLIPFSIYILFTKNLIFKITSIVNIIGSVYIIVFLQARSSYLALSVMLCVLLLAFIPLKFHTTVGVTKKRKLISLVLFTIVGFICIVYFNPLQIKMIALLKARFCSIVSVNQSYSDNNKTIYERLFLWKGSLNIIKDNFLWGVGANNWKIHFPFYGLLYSRAEQGRIIFQRPHNDFLWVFSEQGVFAFILYIFIFFKALFSNISCFFNQESSLKTKLFSLCIFSGLCAYIVIANFSFPKERFFTTFILLAYLCFSIYKTDLFHSIKINRKFFMFISILLLLIFSLRLSGSMSLEKARVLLNQNKNESAIANLRKASSFVYNLDATATPIHWYEGLAWSNLKEYKKAKNSFITALKNNPTHLHSKNNLASSFEFLNQHDSAFIQYYEVLGLSPLFYDAIINICAVSYNEYKLERCFYYLARIPKDSKKLDEQYFSLRKKLLDAITKELYKKGAISEERKFLLLKNDNYLKNKFYESGPEYKNYIKLIVD